MHAIARRVELAAAPPERRAHLPDLFDAESLEPVATIGLVGWRMRRTPAIATARLAAFGSVRAFAPCGKLEPNAARAADEHGGFGLPPSSVLLRDKSAKGICSRHRPPHALRDQRQSAASCPVVPVGTVHESWRFVNRLGSEMNPQLAKSRHKQREFVAAFVDADERI